MTFFLITQHLTVAITLVELLGHYGKNLTGFGNILLNLRRRNGCTRY